MCCWSQLLIVIKDETSRCSRVWPQSDGLRLAKGGSARLRTIARVTSLVPSSASFSKQVAALVDHYQEVLTECLGTTSFFQVKLSVVRDPCPKFFKPCPVPFALRAQVEGKLDCLSDGGVSEDRMPSGGGSQARWHSLPLQRL